MALEDEFRQALQDGDVGLARKLAAYKWPHLPQPKTDYNAEVTFHMARTVAQRLTFGVMAYSHMWLLERGLPSQLPEHLRGFVEKHYQKPRIVEGVGIMVMSTSPERAPLARAIRGAMENVVNEMYADGDREPGLVKQQMMLARKRVLTGA